MSQRSARSRYAGACMVLAVLAGCSGQGLQLRIDPDVSPECELPRVLTVQWQVPAHVPLPLELHVNEPGQPMKAWKGINTHQGEAETGPWASDGLTVSLRTPDGEVLARRTLTTTPCAAQGD